MNEAPVEANVHAVACSGTAFALPSPLPGSIKVGSQIRRVRPLTVGYDSMDALAGRKRDYRFREI